MASQTESNGSPAALPPLLEEGQGHWICPPLTISGRAELVRQGLRGQTRDPIPLPHPPSPAPHPHPLSPPQLRGAQGWAPVCTILNSPSEERGGRPCWAPAFLHGSSPTRGTRTRGSHGSRPCRFSYSWREASGILRAETEFDWGPPAIPPPSPGHAPKPGPRPEAFLSPPPPPPPLAGTLPSTVPDAPLTPPAPGTARVRGYSRGRRARRPGSASRALRAARTEGRGPWSPW